MAIPFWDKFGDAYEEDLREGRTSSWDILRLNGKRVPGICTPADIRVTPHLRIDTKKATGSDGGPAIEVGHDPAKIDISITLWTPRQWALMQEIIGEIWRPPGKHYKLRTVRRRRRDGTEVQRTEPAPETRPAISIGHPCCAMLGISSVLIEAVESLRPAMGNPGVMVLPIRAVQYIPPPPPAQDLQVVRKAAGAGPRTAIAPEFARARSAIPRRPPSETDAVALPGPGPAQGTS